MLRRLNRLQVEHYARQWGFHLATSDITEYLEVADEVLAMLDSLEEPALGDLQQPSRPPSDGEDPLNAVVRWCRVTRTGQGLLAGKRIGLKESIQVAGLPAGCGSRLLAGYVASRDSTLASRLLDQGAAIVAQLNMDSFAISGGGDTSDYGPIRNPLDWRRTAGGSSGGSAAALHYPGIDITFGTDQGGSVRIPASYCGVLGLKPTFGLIPYTGILGEDATVDHVGPLARRVADVALAIQAVSGLDPDDHRQQPKAVVDYVGAIAVKPASVANLRIGLLTQGIDPSRAQPSARSACLKFANQLAQLGATVEEVSIPAHLQAGDIGFAIFIEGTMATLWGHGNGYHHGGLYESGLASALGNNLRDHADYLPPGIKVALLVGSHLRERYFGEVYGAAQNRRAELTAAYDRVLQDFDVVLMPTTPGPAYELSTNLSLSEQVWRGWSMVGNCAPFNLTGHPAMSMPVASVDGMPLGMMVVGRRFDEPKLFQIAAACETSIGWFPTSDQRLPTVRGVLKIEEQVP